MKKVMMVLMGVVFLVYLTGCVEAAKDEVNSNVGTIDVKNSAASNTTLIAFNVDYGSGYSGNMLPREVYPGYSEKVIVACDRNIPILRASFVGDPEVHKYFYDQVIKCGTRKTLEYSNHSD